MGSYRKNAGGGKRDAAEAAIIEAHVARGARVWQLGGTGNPDLLILWRDVYCPQEVKTGPPVKKPRKGSKADKDGKTKHQATIPWPVVRTPQQSLRAVDDHVNALRFWGDIVAALPGLPPPGTPFLPTK